MYDKPPGATTSCEDFPEVWLYPVFSRINTDITKKHQNLLPGFYFSVEMNDNFFQCNIM